MLFCLLPPAVVSGKYIPESTILRCLRHPQGAKLSRLSFSFRPCLSRPAFHACKVCSAIPTSSGFAIPTNPASAIGRRSEFPCDVLSDPFLVFFWGVPVQEADPKVKAKFAYCRERRLVTPFACRVCFTSTTHSTEIFPSTGVSFSSLPNIGFEADGCSVSGSIL